MASFRYRRLKLAAGAADASRAEGVEAYVRWQVPCFGSLIGVGSSPCFAGPRLGTTVLPPKIGTQVPRQHSKSISAASAATASGSLETALSKVTRPSTAVHTRSPAAASLPIEF